MAHEVFDLKSATLICCHVDLTSHADLGVNETFLTSQTGIFYFFFWGGVTPSLVSLLPPLTFASQIHAAFNLFS